MQQQMYDRRVGKTTRAVDEMIQELFTKGETILWDHAHRVDHIGNPTNMALEHAKKILFNRLRMEHSLKWNDGFTYNPKTQTITLNK